MRANPKYSARILSTLLLNSCHVPFVLKNFGLFWRSPSMLTSSIFIQSLRLRRPSRLNHTATVVDGSLTFNMAQQLGAGQVSFRPASSNRTFRNHACKSEPKGNSRHYPILNATSEQSRSRSWFNNSRAESCRNLV